MAVFLVINRWRSLELEQSKAELRVAVIIFRHKKVVKLSWKKYGFKMGFQAMLHHNGLIACLSNTCCVLSTESSLFVTHPISAVLPTPNEQYEDVNFFNNLGYFQSLAALALHNNE